MALGAKMDAPTISAEAKIEEPAVKLEDAIAELKTISEEEWEQILPTCCRLLRETICALGSSIDLLDNTEKQDFVAEAPLDFVDTCPQADLVETVPQIHTKVNGSSPEVAAHHAATQGKDDKKGDISSSNEASQCETTSEPDSEGSTPVSAVSTTGGEAFDKEAPVEPVCRCSVKVYIPVNQFPGVGPAFSQRHIPPL